MVALAATWGSHPAVAVVVIIDLFLVGTVLAAVHHAEVIAHRVDEALRLDRPRRRGDRDRGRPDLLPGRSTLQERGVHLIIFAAFVFLVFNP